MEGAKKNASDFAVKRGFIDILFETKKFINLVRIVRGVAPFFRHWFFDHSWG